MILTTARDSNQDQQNITVDTCNQARMYTNRNDTMTTYH